MLYRITTEDKNQDKALAELILAKGFAGFSIRGQQGYYKGTKENSLVIEIDVFDDGKLVEIYALVKAIKGLLKQECVLLQAIESVSTLI